MDIEPGPGVRMNGEQSHANANARSGTRSKRRPRSAVTSGRVLLAEGNPNSAWSRRYADLIAGHVADCGGRDVMSEGELSLARRASALEVEIEVLEARLSRGEPVNLDEFGRAASHLRRILESLATGLARRPKNITLSLDQYIDGKYGAADTDNH
jgi:hypothetical protein